MVCFMSREQPAWSSMATKQHGKNSERLSAALKATQLGEEEWDLNLALSGCHAVGMGAAPQRK